MDQTTLLTAANLLLSKDVRMEVSRVGQLVVKYRPARRYLVLRPAEWTILRTFEGGRTVPSVLRELILERRCVPLGEFYELIIKAYERGILQTARQTPPEPATPTRWRFALRGRWLRTFTVLNLAAAIAVLFFRPVTAPAGPLPWLIGWVLACLCASAGMALAASVVHGARCELHRPRIGWLSLRPHFRVDLHDVVLGKHEAEVNCAAVRLIPQSLLVTLTAFFWPPLLLPALLGFLLDLSPFWQSPLLGLLRALYRLPRPSVKRDFRFVPNQRVWLRLKAWLQPDELRFAFLRLGYAVVWTLLAALWACVAFDLDARALLDDFQTSDAVSWLAVAAFSALALVLLGLLVFAAIGAGSVIADWWRERASVRRIHLAHTARGVTPQEIFDFLADVHPFHQLSPESRMLAAASMLKMSCEPGTLITETGDTEPQFFILYSGLAEIRARRDTGSVRAPLLPGQVFGPAIVLPGDQLVRSVYSRTACRVLALESSTLNPLIAAGLGPRILKDTAKVGFLRQIDFARHWTTEIMSTFARRSTVKRFVPGETLMSSGLPNGFFYILQDGTLHVKRKGRVIGHLARGDFFGEISLLQNSVITADVVAATAGQCFAMSKHDFLQFLTHNTTVALQVEAIASKRLRHPLFPLSQRNLDL